MTFIRSSGNQHVDDRLLNALYKWTATGNALKELPKDRPDASIPMTFEILLR